ncbi:MAG TPA: hypothetical protein PKE06_04550 [Flavilitoribacter sp.]|nr:hypothetical protein [Flavilitoribacter sp.]HMQ87401.1 hypothetical protein [Flavilitoribacter sp.]
MKPFTVGDFKARFSEILEQVREGEEIAIAFGRKREIVAYLVPRASFTRAKRKLGILAGKARAEFTEDFEMTEEEFLGL